MIGRAAYLATAQSTGRTDLVRNVIGGTALTLLATLCGCSPSYSPNSYAGAAVQQANPTQRGMVVGVRMVKVSADAALGTVTGAAAGGIAGSQVDSGGPVTALSALGGSVLGGLVGGGVAHAEGDTTAYEYIVQETKGDLVSVTQRDTVPLAIGEKVLVIAGKQARVVADYTVPVPDWPLPAAEGKPAAPTAPMPSAVSGSTAKGPAAVVTGSTPGTAPPAAPGTAPPPPPVAASPLPSATAAVPGVPEVAATPPTAAVSAASTPAAPGVSPTLVQAPATAQPGAPVSLALPARPPPTTPAPDPSGTGSATR